MMRALPVSFYRQDALFVANALIGKVICRQIDGQVLTGRITQTEAYMGEEDLACHAHNGKTARNAVMYGAGGANYVYLCYGLHWLYNVVTGKEDSPQAVLIRALEKPLDGPAKWTKAFFVTGNENGKLLTPENGLWIADDGFTAQIETRPRVGIDYAAEPWKSIPWRFCQTERK